MALRIYKLAISDGKQQYFSILYVKCITTYFESAVYLTYDYLHYLCITIYTIIYSHANGFHHVRQEKGISSWRKCTLHMHLVLHCCCAKYTSLNRDTSVVPVPSYSMAEISYFVVQPNSTHCLLLGIGVVGEFSNLVVYLKI